MATLAELLRQDLVIRWNVDLPHGRQPERVLLLLPELASRLNGLLSIGSSWNIEESPAQQLDALAIDFVIGEPLCFGRQFKHLHHHQGGIWYLKTADIRLFGWFPKRDCFIAASAAIAELAKRYNLYHGFGGEAAHLRNLLPIDEPKFVPGDDPNAAVSNFTYPP